MPALSTAHSSTITPASRPLPSRSRAARNAYLESLRNVPQSGEHKGIERQHEAAANDRDRPPGIEIPPDGLQEQPHPRGDRKQIATLRLEIILPRMPERYAHAKGRERQQQAQCYPGCSAA